MKTLITICLTMFLVFGFSSALVAQEIPGGIVYLEAGNAVYHDFATGQKTNLTADLKTVIEGPVAIPEDGGFLLWINNGKFWVRKLPDGQPCQIKEVELSEKVAGQKNISSLVLSPLGDKFAFECQLTDKKFVEVKPGRKVFIENIHENPETINSFVSSGVNYPFYEERMDNYRAVVEVGFGNLARLYPYSPTFEHISGHTACYPPTCFFNYTPEQERKLLGPRPAYVVQRGPFSCPSSFPNYVSHQEAHQRYSTKEEAYYPAWIKGIKIAGQENKQLLAVILKTEKSWGPIRIGFFWGQNFSVEIPISLKVCNGLAWKPDGSLTYLSEGGVFELKIDWNLISSLFQKQIDNYEKDREKYLEKTYAAEKAKAKVFHTLSTVISTPLLTVNPVKIAQGIMGEKVHWVSDDTFLFRRNDNTLCVWQNGQTKQLLSSVAKVFSYCNHSPLALTLTGKEKIDHGSFLVGGIKTRWEGNNTKQTLIWIGAYKCLENPTLNQQSLQFVFPDETNLENIQDPSQYEYQSEYWYVYPDDLPVPIDGVPPDAKSPCVIVRINQIVLLKLGDKYAAIKPLTVERKYKSVDEMPASLRSSWMEYKDKGPLPIPGWMTYEWKYWPAGTVSGISKTKETKPISETKLISDVLPSTSGKAETLERQGWSFTLLAPPDFYIQKGNIRTVWETHGGPPLYQEKLVRIMVGSSIKEKGTERVEFIPMEHALTRKPLEQIENPAVYEYKRNQDPRANVINVSAMLNQQVVILKLGNEYLAIKPLAVKQKYKSLEEVPELLRNRLLTGPFIHLQRDPSKFSGFSLEYEWKYWPGVPSGTPAQEAPAQTAPAQVAGPVNQIQK